MHLNDFPTDTAEHVAQEALKATSGDHASAATLLVDALKVMQRWQSMAACAENEARD